jgi:hypothetical protein
LTTGWSNFWQQAETKTLHFRQILKTIKLHFFSEKKLPVLIFNESPAQSAIIKLKQFFRREPLAIRQPVGSPTIDNYRIGHPENMKCSRGAFVEMIAQSA